MLFSPLHKGDFLWPKKTIKAKELLADIRAGLDDASLMKKYGFSAGGILNALN